ncbi:EDD domain protein, DegV family [Pedococcus dokdonensis]|uniref:EDD domain protein, DegV family n=1 Tax=Pedococcus dokdonensis TaxID=443156 RepID=A0A1H0MAY7_9MICO|nr:DegV family protein [Pedococcus dokdonensis]SDO77619.1 EDD domain protein, DegV family [Pedococcus dokdonensis]
MSVAIVTDSTAYLPASVVDAHSIQVVPLHVIVGGTEFSEGVDITTAEVAAALRSFKPVSTSRPSPQSFLDAYEKAAAGGADGIVSVHISADMSSTVESAHLAAQQSPVPVRVVDSRSLGMAMGYAVVSAAELASRGGTADDVAAQARSRSEASTVVFYVDTLEHLRRGGRIGSASAFLGSALAIKPILGLVDGHIRPLEKVRTSSRALARLEELAASAIEKADAGVDIAVHHLDSQARADDLAARLTDRLAAGDGEVRVVELGAVVGAHVGPGTLAVAVSPRPAP